MDAETQKEINELKAALTGVVNALRQLQLYADGTPASKPGLARLNDYIGQTDKIINPVGFRGQMTP